MTSVVVPAHEEEAVIGRCLGALLADAAPGELEVVVVANGCSDRTAALARSHGDDVTVLERPAAGKAAALNEGDAAATRFPRVYLDADVVLDTATARALAVTLTDPAVHAAAPRLHVDTTGCSRLLARYLRVWERLPVMGEGYVGSGVYAVDQEGHRRIAPFPDLIADDEYVRRSFTAAERATSPGSFDVRPPRTVRAQVHRALRGREGNAQLAARAREVGLAPQQPSGTGRALLRLLRSPHEWPGVAAFAAITALVRARVALDRALPGRRPRGWNRDETSRGSVVTTP